MITITISIQTRQPVTQQQTRQEDTRAAQHIPRKACSDTEALEQPLQWDDGVQTDALAPPQALSPTPGPQIRSPGPGPQLR